MAKTLELNFNAEDGLTKISVRNPKESLTPEEIKAAMEKIAEVDVFSSGKGKLVSPASARVVDRTTEDIELP